MLYAITILIILTISPRNNSVYAGDGYRAKNFGQFRKKFTPEEDQKIINYVNRFGKKNLRKIVSQLPGRSPKHVIDRYINYLAPNINNEPWTEEEDDLIIQKQQELGNRWALIVLCLQGRTPNAVRNRFKKLKKKKDLLNAIKVQCLSQQTDQFLPQTVQANNDNLILFKDLNFEEENYYFSPNFWFDI